MSALGSVDPTELVAGAWQLRPWPAAYADLDDLLAERYPAEQRALERERRVEGWVNGTHLGFAVREITTGASVAEVTVLVHDERLATVAVWVRPSQDPTVIAPAVGAAARRWASGALGLTPA